MAKHFKRKPKSIELNNIDRKKIYFYQTKMATMYDTKNINNCTLDVQLILGLDRGANSVLFSILCDAYGLLPFYIVFS